MAQKVKWKFKIPPWNKDIIQEFNTIAGIVGINPIYRETQFYYEQFFKDVKWEERLTLLLNKFNVKVGGLKNGIMVSKEKDVKERDLVGFNRCKPIIKVSHLELTRTGNSAFKSVCPECKKGVLLVRRNPETLKLEKLDHCVLCGQRFEYLDLP